MSGRSSIATVRRCEPSRRASAAGTACSKKSHTCPPRPGSRALERGAQAEASTATKERDRIGLPALLVEIDGQEKARLVEQQRIDPATNS